MAENWSIDKTEKLLSLPLSKISKELGYEGRLSIVDKYRITEDILLNNSFTVAELSAIKELIKKKFGIAKGEQDAILNKAIIPPTPSAEQSHPQGDTHDTPECGEFKTVHIKEKNGETIKIYRDKTHSAIAQILAEIVTGELAYDNVRQDWSVFNGKAWLPAQPGESNTKFSKIFLEETWPTGYSDGLYRGALSVLSATGLLPLPPQNQDVIPFSNGLLNFKTGEFAQTTPENAQEWVLPYDYAETAGCPNFLRWLKERFSDQDADEIILFIQAYFNATITGKSYHDIFLHLKGIEGSGKSTITRVLSELLGKSAIVSSTLRKLNEGRFELAKLYGSGKRLLVIPEVKKYNDMTMLNAITGRDPLSFEDKGLSVRQKPDFTFVGQTILTSNPSLELSAAQAGAIARRVRTIEFTKKITPEEKIKFFKKGGEQVLYDEAAGIVNWCLELSDDEVDNILIDPPKAIYTANRKAQLAGNSLAMWVDECLEFNQLASTAIGTGRPKTEHGVTYYGSKSAEQTKLYPNYLRWCARNSSKTFEKIDTKSFADDLVNTANRIFETDQIHRPVDNKTGKFIRRNYGYPIMGVAIKPVIDDDEE